MATELQPYTGPEVACPKCRVAGKCSTGYHPKPDRFCAIGFNCPAKWDVKEEHFLRHCRNCGYEWLEGMPVDTPAPEPEDAWNGEELAQEQTLPVPRLELFMEGPTETQDRYKWKWVWHYRLVHRHFDGRILAIPLGTTRCSGGSRPGGVRSEYGPFRDGAHIRHDAGELNLPAYIVIGDECRAIAGEAE